MLSSGVTVHEQQLGVSHSLPFFRMLFNFIFVESAGKAAASAPTKVVPTGRGGAGVIGVGGNRGCIAAIIGEALDSSANITDITCDNPD